MFMYCSDTRDNDPWKASSRIYPQTSGIRFRETAFPSSIGRALRARSLPHSPFVLVQTAKAKSKISAGQKSDVTPQGRSVAERRTASPLTERWTAQGSNGFEDLHETENVSASFTALYPR